MSELASPAAPAAMIQDKAAVMARAVLARKTTSAQPLFGLFEMCRRAGALDESRALLARILEIEPDNMKAQAFSAIFEGRAPGDLDPDQVWPAQFIRLTDFMTPDVHAKIKAMAVEALPQFVPSGVLLNDVASVSTYARNSMILKDSDVFWDFFSPYVMAALAEHRVAETFGIAPERMISFERQVTGHGDGAFFLAHIDADDAEPVPRTGPRLISYVYYFHTQPRRFEGGNLLMFDGDHRRGQCRRDAFTRIAPLDNSIVFFPSRALHEVERVSMPDHPLIDGRFTLNGWARSDAR